MAVAIGLVGALLIWVGVPCNNYLLNNNFISDSYIPEAAVALLLLVALGINPLLGRFLPAYRLTRRQLALMLGIWLVACVPPGSGLMGTLPYSLAKECQRASQEPVLAEAYAEMALPASLHPDQTALGAETPVADGLFGELKPGERVPWRAWMGPLRAWSPLLLGIWLMMIGLALMVYPQWRERERLSFPLLTMYDAMIEAPEPGRQIPSVLRSHLFWAAALIVLVIHSFRGLSVYTHGAFPSFPVEWNFWWLFVDGIWRNAPWTLRGGRVYFLLVGVVYFMPNRTGFSLWFGVVCFALFVMLRDSFFPTVPLQVADFKAGAWVAYAVAIVWLGRTHWATVARAMVSRGRGEELARDRSAGWLFSSGLGVMFCWFTWVGLSVGWAIAYTLFAVLFTLLVSRLVCETGLPVMNFSPLLPPLFISMFPLGWWSRTAVYMGGIMSALFNFGARICAGAMCCLAQGLDRERKPVAQRNVGLLLLGVLVVGLLVCGGVHLVMAYGHEMALDGKVLLGQWGSNRTGIGSNVLTQLQSGARFLPPAGVRWPIFSAGVLLAVLLQAGCMAFPKWLLHPIGLLFIGSWLGDGIWQSIFIGWLLKSVITTYGGAGGYRAARPVFLGLVMGELFAVIIWTLVPVGMILCGADPETMGKLHILIGSS